MKRLSHARLFMILAVVLASFWQQSLAQTVPAYEVDASWPKRLPNDWIIGQVAGIDVDDDDNIWIVHRPHSLTAQEAGAIQNPPITLCCVPAPSVLQFDQEGNLLQAWGGPYWDRETSTWVDDSPGQVWPTNEHGIKVDSEGNVWLAGNGEGDQILKFSNDGSELLMIIGDLDRSEPYRVDSNNTSKLARPAEIDLDEEAREVYVADGYGNRRVIVFDMDTGAYKRHWGAYGNRPDDTPMAPYSEELPVAQQFRGPVHSVRLSDDGLLYVADRTADRIQVFRKNGDFVEEALLAPWTLANGSVWDIEISPEPGQPFLFVADGANKRIWIVERETLEPVGEIGSGGRNAGYFDWLHNLAIDSAGNIYTSEVNEGKRVQKFQLQE